MLKTFLFAAAVLAFSPLASADDVYVSQPVTRVSSADTCAEPVAVVEECCNAQDLTYHYTKPVAAYMLSRQHSSECCD